MCTLREITAIDACAVSDGGIYQSELASATDITDVVFDVAGKITNFVMASLNKWFVYTYDDDDTAYYNQNATRENKKSNKAQVAFFKFAGVSEDMVDFAEALDSCCNVVAIHRFNSGIALAQGVDYMSADLWLYTKKKCVASINILSGTGAEEDRVEVTLNSTGRKFSRPTSLTTAAIQAL
jgi:hypothetical protein